MRVTVLFNRDYDPNSPQEPGHVARAEVEAVAEGVAAALRRRGGVAVELLAATGRSFRFAEILQANPPDVVFNLCESLAGDARGELAIPAILDALKIAYTGSPALCLSLALHKHKAKEMLVAAGVPTPAAVVIRTAKELVGLSVPLPAIVKPAREDASIGISRASVVHDERELRKQVLHVLQHYRQEVLVEQYIDGRELNVSLLGNGPPAVLPLGEIDFSAMPADRPRIVTYAAKWDAGSVEDLGTRAHTVVGEPPERVARIGAAALAAFSALELRDYGRVDVRVDAAGVPYVIDVNPNCDLSDDAGLARAAAAAGLSYDALVGRIFDSARSRFHGDPSHPARRPAAAAVAPHLDRELLVGRGRLRARAPRARAGRQP